MDDMNWGYVGDSKELVMERIAKICQHYKVFSAPYGMIVVEIRKRWIADFCEELKAASVHFDAIYYQNDANPALHAWADSF